MTTFQAICNYIILLGATALGILNVWSLFAKPTSIFKRNKEKEHQEFFKKSLEELIPKYLEENNNNIFEEIKENGKALKEIKEIDQEQAKIIEVLKRTLRDMARQKIEDIYNIHKLDRTLMEYELENLEELYKDYKDTGGNHHIDKLYARMKTWEVKPGLSEYEREEI